MVLHPINRPRPGGDSPLLSRGSVVEYEQHGQPILSVVLEDQRGKWLIQTERDETPSLAAERLFLLQGSTVPPGLSREQRVAALRQLSRSANELAEELSLEEAWSTFESGRGGLSVKEIASTLFPDPAPVQILAVRRALLKDRVFFRRSKESFDRRTDDEVSEGRAAALAAAEEEREREELIAAIVARLTSKDGGRENPLPKAIEILEGGAAFGSNSPEGKIAFPLLDLIEERSGIRIEGRAEDRCFRLLERIGHFDRDFDLNLIRSGRSARFPQEVEQEAEALRERFVPLLNASERALVTGLSFTIDAEETRDADDALTLEKLADGYRLGIHISDVAFVVPEGSACDIEARRRATSVYTPDYTLSMFPRSLAEGTLSLQEGERRAVMSFYAEILPSGEVRKRWIERRELVVSRRLSYDFVDQVLSVPPHDELSTALHELWRLAGLIEASRVSRDAIQFNRRELNPTLKNGTIELVESGEDLPARKLISEMMIFANETAALFGKERSVPLLYRGQEPPEGDILKAAERFPEGPAKEYFMRGQMKRSEVDYIPRAHAGLGVDAYIQGTSPIRRYGDLLNQRQLAIALSGGAPTIESLKEIYSALEGSLDQANYLQRLRGRYFIQRYLQQEKLEVVEGVIVKAEAGRALVELSQTLTIHPFYLRSGSDGAGRVGETVKLAVERNNPRREQLVLREIES